MNPSPSPLNRMHALSWDSKKSRWKLRLTIDRGPKLVGKRLTFNLETSDVETAIAQRDAIVRGYRKLGLKVISRFQKRHACVMEKPVQLLPAPEPEQPPQPKERTSADWEPLRGKGEW